MSKRTLIGALLIVVIGVLVTITRVWVSVQLDASAAAHTSVTVSGTQGIQALMPVAIAIMAIALVLGIAGRVLRVILGVLTSVFGAWIAWTVWASTQRGEDALISFAAPAITEATGLVTSEPASVTRDLDVTVWPVITLVCGMLLVLIGLAVAVFGWRWARGGKRYETRSPSRRDHETVDRIADWDALSGGDDPSDWEDAPEPR